VLQSDAILVRLLQLHPKIIDLSLDRMWRLLDRLGDPQRKLPPVIHVAGTNGKGSTVSFARAMLEAAGLRVHCYVSPHLVQFRERIRLAGELISDPRLSALLAECEEANGGEPITFFEITTAAAFLAFAREPADYLVLEVGLGGRLDATNVIADAAVSVVTTVDYDHQQYLGETLGEIAGEKAGIIKRGGKAVIGYQPEQALAVLRRAGERAGAKLSIAGEDWHVSGQNGRLVFQDDAGLLDLPLPGLAGRHQFENAGNAIAALRLLGDDRVSDVAIASGVRDVSWPARMQRLSGGKLNRLVSDDAELWLDGGHNPSAGRVLSDAFAELDRKAKRPLVLVWGMLNTKDARAFLSPLAAHAAKVICLQIPDEPNALAAATLADLAASLSVPAETADSLDDALRQASASAPSARILICGSLYLAGHVLAAQNGVEMSTVTGTARR
jgi:dihydrofolate synthase/folylpolyglutamate synthase